VDGRPVQARVSFRYLYNIFDPLALLDVFTPDKNIGLNLCYNDVDPAQRRTIFYANICAILCEWLCKFVL